MMKYPEGYIWDYPGISSLTVSYLKTNDFFFSGHVGLPIIIGLDCLQDNKTYIFILSLFICIFESFTMIVTRGHYIIDIFAGIIISHYLFIIVDKYIYILDNYFINKDSDCLEDINNNQEEKEKLILNQDKHIV